MIVLGTLLAAAAAWLALPPPSHRRLVRLAGGLPGPPRRAVGVAGTSLAAGAAAALGAWVLVGGAAGAVLAVACVVLVPPALRRLESRGDRALREQLERQAPLLADLLAATLSSGAPVRAALASVADAVGAPTSSVLRPVLAAIDLGAEPVEAWRAATPVEAHRAILDAIVRATASGAPLSRVLERIAADLRRERRTAVEVAARAAGVRAVAPLAACFLPAFLLLGVVPVVASLAGGMLDAH